MFIRFGSKWYEPIVDIPSSAYCAPLVADIVLFVLRETSCCLSLTVTTFNTTELRLEITDNVLCWTSKASDQPAHTQSLIRAFASRLNIL